MDKEARHREYEERATAALLRAQQAAWKLAKETGTPFIVSQDGKIVDLNAKPEDQAAEAEQPMRVREDPET